jgi:hypothetical protein
MSDVIGIKARAKALEDSFFERENQELLRKLREQAAREDRKRTLREALNVSDDQVLDALVDLDLDTESIVAFGLVPLVEVAWADGSIHDNEREAILRAADERGIAAGSTTYRLLQNWLLHQPDARLLEVWRYYSRELIASLGPESGALLKDRVLGNARAVAEAAGGFLGLGSISAVEKAVLEDLESTFD